MYISPSEMKAVKSKEIRDLQREYQEKVDVNYPGYNRDDFNGIEDYVETLKKAIETGIPWEWKGEDED